MEEANEEFCIDAMPIVRWFAEENDVFSTDDLRPVLEERVAVQPSDWRVLGPVMTAAAAAGWIEKTGHLIKTTQPASHRSPKYTWRSLLR